MLKINLWQLTSLSICERYMEGIWFFSFIALLTAVELVVNGSTPTGLTKAEEDLAEGWWLKYEGLLAGLEVLEIVLSGRVGTLNNDLFGDEWIVGLAEIVGRGDATRVVGELVENIVVAGEMLGRWAVVKTGGTLPGGIVAVTGSPSSSKILRTVVKSVSFLNFTWIRRT